MAKIDNLKNRKYFLKSYGDIKKLFIGFYMQPNTYAKYFGLIAFLYK